MKIAVCSPVYSDPKLDFVVCMDRAKDRAREELGADIWWQPLRSSNLAGSRTLLASLALERRADCIIWADVDHVFPDDAFVQLVRHEALVVGANYARRGGKGEPTAFRFVDGEQKPLAQARGGLQAVDGIGLGLCKVSSQAFERAPRPWFQGSSEDYWFCSRLSEAGIPIYVDHDLSAQVGHLDEAIRYLSR